MRNSMRIRAIAVLIAASLWGQLWAQSDWSNVAQQAKDSIIKIIAHHSEGEATGTGFAVSADGKIATNYHVIEKASKIFVKLPDGRTIGIERVVAFDKRVDLAIPAGAGCLVAPAATGRQQRGQSLSGSVL
jgi:S1-C subfamily serine protease